MRVAAALTAGPMTMQLVMGILLGLFSVTCVFDPADQIFGLKVWLFLALWPITLLRLDRRRAVYLTAAYVLAFVAVPMASIALYFLRNGQHPYAGFSLIKGYLLISLSIVLVVNRVSLLPILSAVLTVLSLMTIALATMLFFDPDYYWPIKNAVDGWGLLIVNLRDYGFGPVMQVYFVTSPMLAISIPYYFDLAMTSNGQKRAVYFALFAINIIALLMVGLRNTTMCALLLLLLLWTIYSNFPLRSMLLVIAAGALAALPFIGRLKVLANPAEPSIRIKLTLLHDYMNIFSDPTTLLTGQGLGAYYHWSASGKPGMETVGDFYFISELTYLELLRNFGLLGTAFMLILLTIPLVAAAFSRNRSMHALALGYASYLLMCATNPLLFSSLGMTIVAVMVAAMIDQSKQIT